LLALVGALFGATVAAVVGGENPITMFERVGKHVLTVGLAFGVIYASLLGLIVGLRNRELRALNAKLVVDAEKAKLGTQLTESRLRLLQAQIEPHFLFNTLGAVQQLAEGRAPEAAALSGHLIRFLRNSMGSFGERPVSLGDELVVVESYLRIMQSRLGERLSLRIDVPESLRRCTLLPTMLLTLVENAIKHGIEPSPAGGEIRVSAHRSDSMLAIEVADTGVGMSETLGDGNGLRNVREQLALAYGDVATLALVENEPHGLIVRLTIPCEGIA
jgi:sensor histidine kinase YesM